MHTHPRRLPFFLLPLLSILLLGCPAPDRERPAEPPPQPEPVGIDPTAAAREGEGRFRLEVNRATRELYVYQDGQRVDTHQVAVGQDEYPTPTGEYRIHKVIWNPEWIPPDSDWAEDRERKAPGDPDNPMGRAQLLFDRPYSIHGTDELESLGRAASHGSVRISNEVVTELARRVMEEGGASRPESWYREAQERRTEKREVDLPNPIPLRIYEGG